MASEQIILNRTEGLSFITSTIASLNDCQKIILNMTEGFYFIYRGAEYKKILAYLFSTDEKGNSRWRRDDKIIFVPDHLREYTILTYQNISPQ